MFLFLLHNKLNLGILFDTAGRKTTFTLFSVERYLLLIKVKAEKIVSHVYVVLYDKRTCNVISEILGNSALVPIQNSVKNFL